MLGTTAHCIWHFALIKHPYWEEHLWPGLRALDLVQMLCKLICQPKKKKKSCQMLGFKRHYPYLQLLTNTWAAALIIMSVEWVLLESMFIQINVCIAKCVKYLTNYYQRTPASLCLCLPSTLGKVVRDPIVPLNHGTVI